MSLILAIESDRRQAARITAIARDRLNVELIVTESAERALEALTALAGRTPDLILTPQLMSPRDEVALNDRLRALDAAGLHVQTLVIPMLASTGRSKSKKGGFLSRLRRDTEEEEYSSDGCEPGVFAAQISEYLKRAAEERAVLETRLEDEQYRAAHSEPAAASVDPQPVQVTEEAFVYTPTFVSSEPVRMYVPPEPVRTYVLPAPEQDWTPPAVEELEPLPETTVASTADSRDRTSTYLSESALAALDSEPAPEVKAPAAAIGRPDMVSFLDSMLDPAPAPVTPPVVTRIDVSGIAELDELVVNDSSTSADELVHFDKSPAEGPRADPLPVDNFLREEAAPAARAVEQRDMLAEFIELDELGIIEGPGVSLGEFEGLGHATDGGDAFAREAASSRRPASVLDTLELLDDPEILDSLDYVPGPASREERAAASARTTAALEAFYGEGESEPAGSEFDFEGDLFTPLPIAAQQRWPRPEGPTVKAAVATMPAFDAPPDPGVEFAPLAPATSGRKKKAQKPAQDEWGMFDPAQCGFAALLEKLNEVTDKEESEQTR